jgi:ribosomal protein S18 acetylase RimI-like enzyme
MFIRPFAEPDLAQVLDLTIETFGPFHEGSFRPLVGEFVFANQDAGWRDDYRDRIPKLHDPEANKQVAVAEVDGVIAGYVAWTVDPAARNGEITYLAVSSAHRRYRAGTALCEHAFSEMRARGAEVAVIGTGGDDFHAPARALYESLDCTMLPTAVYYKQLR